MKLTLALSSALALVSASAFAMSADFTSLDTDASGGISFAELQAFAPDFSIEEFTALDADASTELSEEEFAAIEVETAEGEQS